MDREPGSWKRRGISEDHVTTHAKRALGEREARIRTLQSELHQLHMAKCKFRGELAKVQLKQVDAAQFICDKNSALARYGEMLEDKHINERSALEDKIHRCSTRRSHQIDEAEVSLAFLKEDGTDIIKIARLEEEIKELKLARSKESSELVDMHQRHSAEVDQYVDRYYDLRRYSLKAYKDNQKEYNEMQAS